MMKYERAITYFQEYTDLNWFQNMRKYS